MLVNKIVLSKFLCDTSEKEDLINQVYYHLQDLNVDYREFRDWYYLKVVPQVQTGLRDIVVVKYDHQIAGIAITKKHVEKKICTLRVRPEFQKCGIGKILFEETFSILETEKPIITVSEVRSFEFRRILDYYGFKLEKVYVDYYKNNQAELSYNGLIEASMNTCLCESNSRKILAL